MVAPRATPRILPTLTEVVHPRDAAHAAKPNVPAAALDVEVLSKRIVQKVSPEIEQQVRSALANVLASHMDQFTPDLQAMIERAVHHAVQEELDKKPQPKV